MPILPLNKRKERRHSHPPQDRTLFSRGHCRPAAGAGAAGSCAGTAVRRGPPVHWDGGCHCGTGVGRYAGDSASEMEPAVHEQYYLLVAAKLRETAAHVIAMSVLVLNLRKIQRALLRMLAYLLEILAQKKNWALVQWTLYYMK